jgi:hypothetical protein
MTERTEKGKELARFFSMTLIGKGGLGYRALDFVSFLSHKRWRELYPVFEGGLYRISFSTA